MAGAKVKNPRKKFLWQIVFVKHPINAFLFQKVGIPEVSIEQVSHGDVNYDVKTAGRVSIGNYFWVRYLVMGLAYVSSGYVAWWGFNSKPV